MVDLLIIECTAGLQIKLSNNVAITYSVKLPAFSVSYSKVDRLQKIFTCIFLLKQILTFLQFAQCVHHLTNVNFFLITLELRHRACSQ